MSTSTRVCTATGGRIHAEAFLFETKCYDSLCMQPFLWQRNRNITEPRTRGSISRHVCAQPQAVALLVLRPARQVILSVIAGAWNKV